jgi:predicted lipoprotein with Yx(FWY)xxD motif
VTADHLGVPINPERGRFQLNPPPDIGRTLGMNTSERAVATDGRLGLVLRLTGAALLAVTAAIHLDLYLTGYNTVPTIRWLFLLQVIAAFLLAAAVAVTGSRLVAAAGAGFAIATLGGYLLSVWVGLFGFREVRTTAGLVAGIAEVVAFGALAAFALLPGDWGATSMTGRFDAVVGRLGARLPGGTRGSGGAVGAVSLVALVVLVASVATASGAASPVSAGGANALKSTTIGGVTVLTNAKGFTLYWFAPDSPTKSVCNGACTAYWPPVGPAALAPGVAGHLTTITRSDGSKQAAYNGHPLYTYLQDSKPGQNTGNNVTLNGGKWFEVKVGR